MPDLPSPRNATEAALFSEYWDTVLSYADLCTSGSAAAHDLAHEALTEGLRELRAEENGTGGNPGRRVPRLPAVPQLLTAVRATAAAWETQGHGHRLAPDLRLWLHSEQAARYTGPPLRRPLALRALRDMQESDADLLWLTEVESLPSAAVARRLRLDPAGLAEELAEVRGLFRDRCRRGHLDRPMDAECRAYARLLDAVTRAPVGETPEDLSHHLARCAQCAEAAACLRPHGGGLPAALAGGVIGWGGLAYLERRRRAAEVRLGPGRPDFGAETEPGNRGRVLRNGLIVAAVLVSMLALAVSLMPFGGTGDEAARRGTDDRRPVADTRPSPQEPTRAPSSPGTTGSPAAPSPSPSAARTPDGASGRPSVKTVPRTRGTAPTAATTTAPSPSAPPACRATYTLDNEWPDGFQATVTVTTEQALDDWRLTWSFPDGQRVTQMWDADHTQQGSRVAVTAASYNRAVPAGGRLSFGFLGSWYDENGPASGFALNGKPCAGS
ncbi:cellulose binding domain-containing protein [Streptomyces sp. NPDC005017]|uniref:cellulose binding domain-containing protein n=1 Tax=Streptomyces sp. NPDC005017 TaxID=3364706 RepID=UPI0036D0ACDD